MEDPVFAVFHRETSQVIYKSILTLVDVQEINALLVGRESGWEDGATGLATGIRPFLGLDLEKDLPDLIPHVKVVLRDYFPDLEVSTDARFYNHQLGSVKPHVDGNRDGKSNYTLLLYLGSDFEGGRLSIKMRRSNTELLESEPNKYHKVFTFEPLPGWGVIFHKSLLHWATEVIDGNKNFLLLHLHSEF